MLYFQFHQVSKAWALDVMPICLQDLLVVLYKSGEPYESHTFFANLFSITVLPVMASAADFVDCKPGVGGRQSCLCWLLCDLVWNLQTAGACDQRPSRSWSSLWQLHDFYEGGLGGIQKFWSRCISRNSMSRDIDYLVWWARIGSRFRWDLWKPDQSFDGCWTVEQRISRWNKKCKFDCWSLLDCLTCSRVWRLCDHAAFAPKSAHGAGLWTGRLSCWIH